MEFALQLPASDGTALRAGSGRLDFVQVRGRTVIRSMAAASPLQFLNPKNHGHAAWVFTSSHGGGMVGGDRVRLKINVGAGASALISTQASSKVFRSELTCRQELDANVEDGGMLAIIPDPLVCFAGSHFSQRQALWLDAAANLVMLDWLGSGRQAAGERWAFRQYSNRIDIFRGGDRVLREAVLLDPAHGELAGRMGRFNSLALVIVSGPQLAPHAAAIASQVEALPLAKRADVIQSVSPLRDSGVVLRVAGETVERVGEALRQHLSFLKQLLGDDPWTGKW